MSLLRFAGGMFGRRRPTTAAERAREPLSAEAIVRRVRERAEARVEIRNAALDRDEVARQIKEECLRTGAWFPRKIYRGRGLGARPTVGDRIAAAFETWSAIRRGDLS